MHFISEALEEYVAKHSEIDVARKLDMQYEYIKWINFRI